MSTFPAGQIYRHRLIFTSICVIIASIVIASGIALWRYHVRKANDKAATAALLVSLGGNLTSALRAGDNQSIVNVATQLIDGQANGLYTIDTKTLALDHLYRASSLSNLKKYDQALQDYQQAEQLDSSVKEAALKGEVSAGYQLGQRQQLIPLLQQLETISESKNHNPLNGTPALYKYEIQAIEKNKPIRP